MNGLGGGFQVDPDIRQAEPQRCAPVHAIGAEDPAQLRQQRVEAGIDRVRVGLPPQGLGDLVAGNQAVPVDHKVREQKTALAAWQHAVQSLAVALDGQQPADLDPKWRARRRQGHANILALRWEQSPGERYGGTTVKLIRCECGYVARGDSDDQVVGEIRGHMASDHPALLKTVSQQDLLSWIQTE